MVYVFDDLKHVIYAKIIKKNKENAFSTHKEQCVMDCQVWIDECTDRIRHQTIALTCQMFLFYTFQQCGH